MDKNRFLPLRPSAAGPLALFLLWSVLATMLTTRAGLSISMALLGVFAVATGRRQDWRSAGWALLGGAWMAGYVLSYFWSDDKIQWARAVEVKIPLLLLPIAFALLPRLEARWIRRLITGCLIVLSAGVVYSVTDLLANPARVIEGYRVSHVLRTPLFNSHIHFSALVACFIAIGAAARPLFSGWKKIAVGVALLALAAYLHILASKTGLVMLYVFAAAQLVRMAVRGKPLRAVASLAILGAVVWIAFSFIPTLNKRAHYVNYTIVQVLDGRRDGLYSDLGRALSWEVGARLVARHPVAGVGAGDMLHAMRREYQSAYPNVAPENHLIPHNQPLCVALTAGLPTALLFLFWLLAPLRWLRQHGRRFCLRITWLMLLVPLLVEPFLEVQAGVAVYLYALLICQYLLRSMDAGSAAEHHLPAREQPV